MRSCFFPCNATQRALYYRLECHGNPCVNQGASDDPIAALQLCDTTVLTLLALAAAAALPGAMPEAGLALIPTGFDNTVIAIRVPVSRDTAPD